MSKIGFNIGTSIVYDSNSMGGVSLGDIGELNNFFASMANRNRKNESDRTADIMKKFSLNPVSKDKRESIDFDDMGFDDMELEEPATTISVSKSNVEVAEKEIPIEEQSIKPGNLGISYMEDAVSYDEGEDDEDIDVSDIDLSDIYEDEEDENEDSFDSALDEALDNDSVGIEDENSFDSILDEAFEDEPEDSVDFDSLLDEAIDDFEDDDEPIQQAQPKPVQQAQPKPVQQAQPKPVQQAQPKPVKQVDFDKPMKAIDFSKPIQKTEQSVAVNKPINKAQSVQDKSQPIQGKAQVQNAVDDEERELLERLERAQRLKELREQVLAAEKELESLPGTGKQKSQASTVQKPSVQPVQKARVSSSKPQEKPVSKVMKKLNSFEGGAAKPKEEGVKPDKISLYTAMKDDELYTHVRKYLKMKEVQRKPVSLAELNQLFGAANIKRLLVKSYLIAFGKGVTIGRKE